LIFWRILAYSARMRVGRQNEREKEGGEKGSKGGERDVRVCHPEVCMDISMRGRLGLVHPLLGGEGPGEGERREKNEHLTSSLQ